MNKNDMNMKRQQRFIKVVSRRMAKAGFECKMVDNHFIVIMDGKPFEVGHAWLGKAQGAFQPELRFRRDG